MAKEVKAAASRGIKATEQEIENFNNSLDLFLRRNLKRLLKELKAGETGALEAANLLGGLKSAIEDVGLVEQIGGLNGVYANELDRITSILEKSLGRNIVYTAADIDALETLITFDIEKTTSTISRYVDDVRSTLMKQVILGEKIDTAALIDDGADKLKSVLDTEINTSVAGYSRAINQKKAADAGATKFLYAGPYDDRIRPFCEERVGKIFTLEQIQAWDNEQGLPAEIYLGGYNCRHRLIAMSDKMAEELQ